MNYQTDREGLDVTTVVEQLPGLDLGIDKKTPPHKSLWINQIADTYFS